METPEAHIFWKKSVAGQGIEPCLRDYEPRVQPYTTPRVGVVVKRTERHYTTALAKMLLNMLEWRYERRIFHCIFSKAKKSGVGA